MDIYSRYKNAHLAICCSFSPLCAKLQLYDYQLNSHCIAAPSAPAGILQCPVALPVTDGHLECRKGRGTVVPPRTAPFISLAFQHSHEDSKKPQAVRSSSGSLFAEVGAQDPIFPCCAVVFQMVFCL